MSFRYNMPCRNEKCGGGGWERRFRQQQDIVCRTCYYRLPENLRKGLWPRPSDKEGEHEARAKLALNWLDENPEVIA